MPSRSEHVWVAVGVPRRTMPITCHRSPDGSPARRLCSNAMAQAAIGTMEGTHEWYYRRS